MMGIQCTASSIKDLVAGIHDPIKVATRKQHPPAVVTAYHLPRCQDMYH